MEAIRDAELLIGATARAFYPDDCVVVLDALVRDKYIREDEMAARLRMSARQARRVLQLLEGERLVEHELLNVGQDGSLVKRTRHEDEEEEKKRPPPAPSEIYWYIDLRKFCDVVRWRVHVMRETLKGREGEATSSLTFTCQRCGSKVSSLDAVRSSFRCLERLCADEADAVLKEDTLEAHLSGARALAAKVDEQLGGCEALGRTGIFELLLRLDGKELPRNMPSENRERGVGGWLGAKSRADEAGAPRVLNADGTITAPKNRSGLSSALFARNERGQTVTVDLHGDGDDPSTKGPASPRKPAKDSSLPEFLRGSRVTAKELLAAEGDDDDDMDDDAAGATGNGEAYLAAKAASKTATDEGRGGAVRLGARGGWGEVVVDPGNRPSPKRKAPSPPPPPPVAKLEDGSDEDSVMWE